LRSLVAKLVCCPQLQGQLWASPHHARKQYFRETGFATPVSRKRFRKKIRGFVTSLQARRFRVCTSKCLSRPQFRVL
jgi:hypothetical protein